MQQGSDFGTKPLSTDLHSNTELQIELLYFIEKKSNIIRSLMKDIRF